MPTFEKRVPYINLSGKYRPYLEVIFVNNHPKTRISNKTLALIDSGADFSVIPYSLGKQINLPPINAKDTIHSGQGVSGRTSLLEKKCIIYLINNKEKKLYGVNESVYWAHPDRNTLNILADLKTKYYELKDFEINQCKPNTKLASYFKDEQNKVLDEYVKIENFFETGILLGRPFFDNFDFIQFFHRDRNKEDQCFFTYVFSKKKNFREIDLTKMPKS